MFDGFGLIPFVVGGGLLSLLAAVTLVVFWIWMIVDCIKRKFNEDLEKIVWILIMLFANWLGALTYFIIIKILHKRGIYNLLMKDTKNKKRKKR